MIKLWATCVVMNQKTQGSHASKHFAGFIWHMWGRKWLCLLHFYVLSKRKTALSTHNLKQTTLIKDIIKRLHVTEILSFTCNCAITISVVNRVYLCFPWRKFCYIKVTSTYFTYSFYNATGQSHKLHHIELFLPSPVAQIYTSSK